ncbi:MAG: alpha/beta hydrolase [Actinomycetota bacterium]|nr:alpha/beta hydrolase [Actinomycetota bacterium]
MEHRTVDLGGPVHYVDFGGSGQTLVLVHGLGGATVNWGASAPLLAEGARVLAVDLAGFGRTPRAGRSSSISANRELLDAFLEHVVAEPAVVAGNSMGGLISLLEAAESPDRVSALVLVDPALPAWVDALDPVVTQLFAAYATPGVGEALLASMRDQDPRQLVEFMLALTCADPGTLSEQVVNDHVEFAIEYAGQEDAQAGFLEGARNLVEVLYQPDRVREAILSVSAPTLLVHGALDRLVPLVAAETAASMRPDWTFEVMAKIGHVPMMEDPEGFTRIVLKWLSRISAPAAARSAS